MLVVDDGIPDAASVDDFRLDLAVASLYADVSVDSLLHRLLAHSRRLLHTAAGSVSLVDRDSRAVRETCRGRRRLPGGPIASRWTRVPPGRRSPDGCRSSSTTTATCARRTPAARAPGRSRRGRRGSAVVARRGDRRQRRVRRPAPPVHRRGDRRASSCSPRPLRRPWSNVAAAVPSLAMLLREHGLVGAADLGVQTVVTEVGAPRPVPHDGGVDRRRPGGAGPAGRRPRPSPPDCTSPSCTGREGLRLLVQDEAAGSMPPATDPLGLGTRTWDELAAITAGVRGGGDRRRARPRLGDVAACGLSRASAAQPTRPVETVAAHRTRAAGALPARRRPAPTGRWPRDLVISPKTVEKHVGAVLRKTRTPSRTAAVAHALDRGWLPPARTDLQPGAGRR